jgi:hypothetical protein
MPLGWETGRGAGGARLPFGRGWPWYVEACTGAVPLKYLQFSRISTISPFQVLDSKLNNLIPNASLLRLQSEDLKAMKTMHWLSMWKNIRRNRVVNSPRSLTIARVSVWVFWARVVCRALRLHMSGRHQSEGFSVALQRD